MPEMHEPASGPAATVVSVEPPAPAAPVLPATLVAALRRRELVLVVGSGAVELGGRPGWRGLIRAAAGKLADDAERDEVLAMLDGGRGLGALAALRESLGEDALAAVVAEEAARAGEIAEPLVRLLRVPFRGIVTTAVDDLVERALAADGAPPTRLFAAAALAELRAHRGRFLLHLCGRATEPASLALAPQEVRTRLVDGGVAAYLADLHRDAALLLVGFRPGDPDLTLVAERLLGATVTSREKFLVCAGAAPAAFRVATAELGATAVPLDGSLADAITALADACATAIGDDPAPDDAEGWLERWALEPDDLEIRGGVDEAVRLLRERKEWQRLVAVQIQRAEIDPQRAAQLSALREVARLCETELSAPERAYHALDAALKLSEDDPALLAEAERVATAAGLLDELARDHAGALTAVARDPARPIGAETARALAQHHTATGEHEALAATLERLVDLASSDDERVGLLTRIAAAHAARPDGEARALDARERAFRFGARDEDTLLALTRAYEAAERWRPLAEVLARHAEAARDPMTRAERLARLGGLLLEQLADPAAAEERYLLALDADPESPRVLAALGAVCRRRGDLLRAAKFLADAAQRTRSPLERARLLAEAGTLHHRELGDDARGAELYDRALAEDPEQIVAAEGLAEIRERQESWVPLEPLLDLLVRKAEPARANELQGRLGRCALQLGKRDKARRCFEAARRAADPVPALRALADLLVSDGAWPEARAVLNELRERAESLSVAERVAMLSSLGLCAARLGENDDALAAYDDAAVLAPDDRAIAAAAVELLVQRADWEAVVTRRRALAEKSEGEARAQLWEDVGDVLLHQQQRPDDALAAYGEALAAHPGRRTALHKTLELHTTAKRWPEASAVLHQLIESETEPAVRARYAYTAAVIARDELADRDGAVALFNRALDDDAGMMKAYEAVEKLLTAAQDYVGLKRSYKKMLKRLPPTAPVEMKLGLLDALTSVSLDHIGDRETATVAMEVAVTLDPDNLQRRERLAQLYLQAGPAEADKAIAQHHQLLTRQPDRIDSYRALAALYQRTEAYDKLWCVCATMAHLGQLEGPLNEFYQRNRSTDVPVAMGKFTDDVWRLLAHPDEDPYVGAIFALTASALASTSAQPHSSVGLKRGERVDVATTDWFPAVALRYVSTTLALPLPDVFVTDRAPGSVSLLNLREKSALTPALLVGPTFNRWTTQWDVVFDLARHVALLSSERFPRVALLGPAAQEHGLRAALALGGCTLPGGRGEHEKLVKKIASLVPSPASAEIGTLGRKMLEGRAAPDLARWMAGVDLTAARAAFLLASDLAAASRVLGAEPAGASPLPVHDRMRDLVIFSVSEPFFAAREALGLAIG